MKNFLVLLLLTIGCTKHHSYQKLHDFNNLKEGFFGSLTISGNNLYGITLEGGKYEKNQFLKSKQMTGFGLINTN